MSNPVAHNLLNLSLIRPVTFEHQNKLNSSCAPTNSIYQAAWPNQAAGKIGKSQLGKEFYGKGLNRPRQRLTTKSSRPVSVVPQAVLAMDPSSQAAEKFSLDGNIELQVEVTPTTIRQVNIQITHSSESLLLHWGAIRDKKEKWVFPSRFPDGTKNYKNRALRTPFLKSGAHSYLKLEIDDPAIQAIEFLIFDEARNKWFKNNGQNFHIKLPTERFGTNGQKLEQNISVPEDLVQIQAYIRWERKGKQNYTPEQEKEEYEAARMELLEEIARGASVEDLRAKLMKKDDTSGSNETKGNSVHGQKTKIPDDLVQIQAYIRWEKAGKPTYSPEQELREFEEARLELLSELEKGVSLDDIHKKIVKGEIQTKVSKQLRQKKYFSVEKIQRKARDLNQLICKHTGKLDEPKPSLEPRALTTIELYAKAKEEQETTPIFCKKHFKLGSNEILVLVTKLAEKMKIQIATDFQEPVTVHWALSQKGGEWLEPPSAILPPNSVPVKGAVDTQLTATSADLPSPVQTLELEIDGDSYKGMPFVLNVGEQWIKNNGSDFYVDFVQEAKQVQKDAGDGKGTARVLLDKIAEMESEAQKSFMHRFNIAADLVDEAKSAGKLGFAGLLVWMRFMAIRQLVWNKNYNVKPREISKAQDRLTDILQDVYANYPEYRELLRMIMSTVGRGGEGDVGQRIRDEILVIQRNNNCKGGIMEEWHQKLHNNTSPDDVIICQALIDYIKSDFDISVYWKTLNDNGITKERLLSYDRAIHSEPDFKRDQKEGLLRDLGHYMRTLKAVHSGADLESAIANCMGYSAEGQGFMVGVQINPISGLPSGYPDLLRFVLEHIEDRNVEALLEGLLEARQELRSLLLKPRDRLKDLLFLDLSLDSTVRTAIERGYEELNDAGPEKIMYFISLVVENLALSSDDNEDLIYCLKGWQFAINMFKGKKESWALYAKSVLDRTRLALASKGEWYHQVLQPSAEYLGSHLGVDQWAVNIFTEEIIRAGSAAALSSLLNRLDPVLRQTAHLGSWQVISPVEVVGYVTVVDELLDVQNKTYNRPTIIVSNRVKGEEEIPDGAVAVLTPDMPDVLSHVSVRARNCKVCFATCFDSGIMSDLQAKDGKLLKLQPTSADVIYRELSDSELLSPGSVKTKEDDVPSTITLVKKQFGGRYSISSEEFTSEMVGAKSRNIGYLKGKVPSWIGIPTSIALPFGVFEKVLSEKANQGVAEKLQVLKKRLEDGNHGALRDIREAVLDLVAPTNLVEELKGTMQSSGMPWPGAEGEQRWEQAWTAIKKVWASKWNERAYFSTRKVRLDHDYLCMAVLVQEIVNADYAFVIHTTNPSSGDSSEIYAEVVKGLGETLVGAYPGRALSFIAKKSNLDSPQVLGYPSKPIGLFIRRSIIFRSDSNGEDLEGYAGAGLYDSVPMDEEEEVVLDYTTDPLITDENFQKRILSSIARSGDEIEKLYGSPQDIEGVIRDGKLYVVQTRPQM
ncbi:PREDICTED: alpha-glucan water dikinase, chloroplastic [Tarenaya hassleriana]|uniref:alpha-glucan water dikinase, chloroplastic n=1 Tax=Tarenaya hassleriana TaxID=28532 RepID=UPI00053C96D2|nr:PREDICTED: alpha-glucan water dikinase, chloroplastic [Tarenaya hassleriana]